MCVQSTHMSAQSPRAGARRVARLRRSRPRHARTSSPTQTILAHATHATRRDARRCDRAPNHIPPRCMHCRTLAGPVRCSHLPWRVALGTAFGGRMQSNAEHGRRGLAAVGRPSDRAGRIAWLAWHVLNGSPRSTPLSKSKGGARACSRARSGRPSRVR